MRSWGLPLVCIALGCARPTAPPKLAIPDRCVCETAASDCDHDVAIAPYEPVPEATSTSKKPDVTRVIDTWFSTLALDVDAKKELTGIDEKTLEREAAAAVIDPEKDLLRAIRELREVPSDDTVTPVEKDAIRWSRFHAEVERLRENATRALDDRVAQLLFTKHAVANEITRIFTYVNQKMPAAEKVTRDYIEQRAMRFLVEVVRPVSEKHIDALVASRTGRWIGALNAKADN